MKFDKILKEQIQAIKPDAEELKNIKNTAKGFCEGLKKKLNKKKIKADVFIGGSLAKNTLVKKDKYDTEKISSISQTPNSSKEVYDVDIFVRFDKKYNDKNISEILGRVLSGAKKVHGSRDYYKTAVNNIIIEVVPVLKINNPQQAQNRGDNHKCESISQNPEGIRVVR